MYCGLGGCYLLLGYLLQHMEFISFQHYTKRKSIEFILRPQSAIELF
jgi:hypothetical protein